MYVRMRVFTLTVSAFLLVSAFGLVRGQDPTKVDASHYKVVFENEHVRVLRITYGPGEKSVMHEHPVGVAISITDNSVRMTMPDGSTEDTAGKAGDAEWHEAGKYLPENLGDTPMEVILVELKGQ